MRKRSETRREGGAAAVKLEGGSNRTETIKRIVAAEIPVMGHLGLTPQSVNAMGGYKVQGKAIEDAQQMIADARALEAAGVFSIVLEGVPDVLAAAITDAVSVPTIGIGAGDATDGQVLVFHDVLGLGGGKYPKFVRSYTDLRARAIEALQQYAADVQSGAFPADEETYHVRDEVARMLAEREAPSDAKESSSSSQSP
jgi:3-methyl-2-oxobutanoate hydroxymethyltransferase